jgi:quinoprotein glucose dehydrogenase
MLTAGSLLAQPAGDAVRGKAVFEGKGECLTCHRVNGNGSRLGPDLSEIGMARRENIKALETSILDPDAEVLPANRYVRVVTKAGTTLIGRLLNQDNFTVQLLDAMGKLRSFSKTDLRESAVLTKSQMPSYKGRLSDQEVADLVSYLASLKGIDKQ